MHSKKPLRPLAKLRIFEILDQMCKKVEIFNLKNYNQKIPTFKYADKTILEHKMRLYANGLVGKVYYNAITNINKPGKKMKNEFKKSNRHKSKPKAR